VCEKHSLREEAKNTVWLNTTLQSLPFDQESIGNSAIYPTKIANFQLYFRKCLCMS